MIRFLIVGLALAACLACVEPPKAEAGNCGGYTRSYSTTYQAHGYKVATNYAAANHNAYAAKDYEVVFQKFLAVVPLAVYPSYSAVYAPPPPVAPGQPGQPADPARQQQSQGELQQVLTGLKEVTTTLRDFDSRLRILESRQGVQPAPQALPQPQALPKQPAPKQGAQAAPKQHTFASVNASHCAACHAKGNEANGGEFVLSDAQGKMVKLTDAQVGKMSKVLLRGTMPKLNEYAAKHGITARLTEAESQAILEEVDRQVGGTQ